MKYLVTRLSGSDGLRVYWITDGEGVRFTSWTAQDMADWISIHLPGETVSWSI